MFSKDMERLRYTSNLDPVFHWTLVHKE